MMEVKKILYPPVAASGKGGRDLALVKNFIDFLMHDDISRIRTVGRDSVHSHIMAFSA